METMEALELGRSAITTGLLVVAPMLIAGLVTGLLFSILLAATQIQEFTLTFIPKILMTALAGMLFGPWMVRMITGFTIQVFSRIAQVGH
jgi:flagellar biosynthetic protein FliQ